MRTLIAEHGFTLHSVLRFINTLVSGDRVPARYPYSTPHRKKLPEPAKIDVTTAFVDGRWDKPCPVYLPFLSITSFRADGDSPASICHYRDSSFLATALTFYMPRPTSRRQRNVSLILLEMIGQKWSNFSLSLNLAVSSHHAGYRRHTHTSGLRQLYYATWAFMRIQK